MKKSFIKITAVTGLLCAFLLPLSGFADAVEDDVKAYAAEKKPNFLKDYAAFFTNIFGKHAPLIKESTMATTGYYFDTNKANTFDDIATLTGQAVTAAIAQAGQANAATYIQDATCGSFRGGLNAGYIQVTSAKYAVRGALTAALAAGIEPGVAATAVVRGIDTCLSQRLIYEVALAVGRETSSILGAQGFAYYYNVPYTAYYPIDGEDRFVDIRPDGGVGTDTCVSDCVPEDEKPKPPVCVSNCIEN